MANITATAGTLGFAGAVADIVVWRYNGHPLPVPEDVVAAFAIVIGVGTHALGIAAQYVGLILQQKLDIKVDPPQAGS